VQNGVLLTSYFNQMRAAGATVREAVTRGAELRLRPVAMTSLTAILGLLPAALAESIGSQAQKPLAIVVVGGISTALLLALYLIPALYSYFPAPRGREPERQEPGGSPWRGPPRQPIPPPQPSPSARPPRRAGARGRGSWPPLPRWPSRRGSATSPGETRPRRGASGNPSPA